MPDLAQLEGTVSLGAAGIMSDLPPAERPEPGLEDATNITYAEGYVQKAFGSARYNSADPLSDTVLGIHDWHPDSVKQRVFAVTADGKIFRDIGDKTFNSATAIKTGLLGLTASCQFIEAGAEASGSNRKLFFLSTTNQIQVLSGDGATWADINTPAADWNSGSVYPTCGIVHRNRLWVFKGSYAYASSATDHEEFVTSVLLLNVLPGEGEDIVATWIFKGKLYCSKRGGYTYELIDTDTDSSNWHFKRYSKHLGVASPNSIEEVGDDILIGNEYNTLTSMEATQAFGDARQADLYKALLCSSYFRKKTFITGKDNQHILYYPFKKLTYITNRGSANALNDRLVVIDTNAGRPRVSVETKDSPQCLGLIRDVNKVPRPFYGNESGYLMELDKETRLVHTSAFTGQLKTKHYDMSHLDPKLKNLSKLWRWMTVEYFPEGNWNLSAEIIIDGKIMETVTFPMNEDTNAEVDVMKTDTGHTVASNTQTSIMRPLHGEGKRIGVRFFQAGASQSFKLASFTVGFDIAGHNPVKLS